MSASSSTGRSASSSSSRASLPTCTRRSTPAGPMSMPWRPPATVARPRARMPPAASSMPRKRRRRCALDAIQLLGGNGYINDYPTGRLLRDAKLYEIGAGTTEIRRMLIGREMMSEEVCDGRHPFATLPRPPRPFAATPTRCGSWSPTSPKRPRMCSEAARRKPATATSPAASCCRATAWRNCSTPDRPSWRSASSRPTACMTATSLAPA